MAALAGPLVLYAVTASRDVGSIDSGELAAACARLGIAHPTGYPLYTLIGRLASLALPAATPIARLNLLSGIFAAVSALFVYYLFLGIARFGRPDSGGWSERILALGGSWLWAVHPALWSQGTGNEVHAAQAALVAALLALAQSDAARRGSFRTMLLVFYVGGLCFTNHMSAIYLVPGLIAGALCDPRARALMRQPWRLAAAISAALVPITLYLYLPIRAGKAPIQDWGDPQTLTRFLRHVGGAQYRVWMFSSSTSFDSNLASFAREFANPLGFFLLALVCVGVVRLVRRDPPGLARLGLGLLVGTIWASGYDIHDIEPYYMIPRLCIGGLAIAGASVLLPPSTETSRIRMGIATRARAALPILPLALSLVLVGTRFKEQDRSGDRFVRLYATSILDRLPPHAILLSRHWDMVVSPIIYLQQIEGTRPDVTVVDTELLRRSWYFPVLRRVDPSLLAGIEDRVSLFLEDLRLFEANRPYDPQRIEEHYRAVIAGIFESHRAERPVFHTPDVEPTFYAGWYGIPEALDVRVSPDPAQAPEAAPIDPSAWSAQARYVDDPVRRDTWAFPIELGRSRVQFLERFGRGAEAARWRASVEGLEAIPLPKE